MTDKIWTAEREKEETIELWKIQRERKWLDISQKKRDDSVISERERIRNEWLNLSQKKRDEMV